MPTDSGPLSPPPQPPSLEQLKAGLRATWIAGDFGRLARRMETDAEAFVASLRLAPGTRVLDVACGTGNLSIPLARSGCIVTGVDIAPNLLAQARDRAAAEHLTVTFDEGDAEHLPYATAAFDAVVSMFGAMFAPRPALVASELARVLHPGGLLAMANWTPSSFTGEMFRTTARHAPPPPGVPPPVLWGDPATVTDRLAPFFTDTRTSPTPISFDLDFSAAGTVSFFREFFGPTRTAFSRLDPAGQQALYDDLVHLWSTHNRAEDPASHTRVPNEFLTVLATRIA